MSCHTHTHLYLRQSSCRREAKLCRVKEEKKTESRIKQDLGIIDKPRWFRSFCLSYIQFDIFTFTAEHGWPSRFRVNPRPGRLKMTAGDGEMYTSGHSSDVPAPFMSGCCTIFQPQLYTSVTRETMRPQKVTGIEWRGSEGEKWGGLGWRW